MDFNGRACGSVGFAGDCSKRWKQRLARQKTYKIPSKHIKTPETPASLVKAEKAARHQRTRSLWRLSTSFANSSSCTCQVCCRNRRCLQQETKESKNRRTRKTQRKESEQLKSKKGCKTTRKKERKYKLRSEEHWCEGNDTHERTWSIARYNEKWSDVGHLRNWRESKMLKNELNQCLAEFAHSHTCNLCIWQKNAGINPPQSYPKSLKVKSGRWEESHDVSCSLTSLAPAVWPQIYNSIGQLDLCQSCQSNEIFSPTEIVGLSRLRFERHWKICASSWATAQPCSAREPLTSRPCQGLSWALLNRTNLWFAVG